MLSAEEKQELTVKSDELQKEGQALRKRLSELNGQKEALFDQRNKVSKQISEKIGSIRGIRSERDTLTGAVKLSKVEREKLNDQIKKRIAETKTLTAEFETIKKKQVEYVDARQLKRQVDKLNYKMETEALSFDKERKLMKAIKDLQKQYIAASKVQKVKDRLRKLSREIREMKSTAQQAHKKVKHSADESQKKHEGLIKVSTEIDDLKKQETDITKQIQAKKAEMKPVGDELDSKTKEINEIRKKLGLQVKHQKQKKAAAEKKQLGRSAEEIRLKLKRGEKLTTEDILILQGADEK